MNSTITNEILKLYPKGVFKETILKGETKSSIRFFKNPKKNNGSYSLHGLHKVIVTEKIKKVVEILDKKLGIKVIDNSLYGNSYYLGFQSFKVRISDHNCHPDRAKTYSKYVVVKYNDDIWKIIDYITD